MENTEDRFRSAWDRIVTRARTAEQHAAVLDARRHHGRASPPNWAAMDDHYARMINAGVFAVLDALPLSASHTAELGRLVDAGAAGLPPFEVDPRAREILTRLHLADWCHRSAATHSRVLVATLAGIAVSRSAATRPLVLSASDAATLSDLEADGGRVLWPGTVTCLRMCGFWGLADQADGRYVITPDGRQALAQHRSQASQQHVVPTEGQGIVLEFLARSGLKGDVKHLAASYIKQCIGRGWMVRSGMISGTRRSAYRITETGRDALARWALVADRKRQQRARLTAGQVRRGMWVRLLTRGPGVGLEFVKVEGTVKVPGPNVRTPKWQIWVSDGKGRKPYIYGDRPFFQATRFEQASPQD